MMAIFIATTRLFIMAKIEVMEYYELALNWSNGLKVIAKRNKSQILWPFPLYFEPKLQLVCGPPWDAWICLNFFGSSPTLMEWDKIVAEIISATFVFLGHPNRQRNGVRRG